ncbi:MULTISPECIES: DMT family transporter [Bacillus]|uniref:DMT family transporter n=1 Tax=Bacillus paramycoides TaxID=2026194 RepID=A0ABU6MV90_9BACI|nr:MULTISPECIES: DMT family transporter [Bacillus]KMN42211.1 membrane protein [Bacillus sp. LK2]MED0965755.1 DMT family transporter [Bacillus paramycoides]MED0987597.1 DMT family transporter [Bacillus paramycoides]MED1115125.1 DMT family transporter [Bacillus paramycoides]MED1408295.1 DMT family transporter [Bacillus paramycoides]
MKYKGDITLYNFLSVFIGALIAIMIPLNGILSEIIGNYTASVVIHLVGLVAVVIVLIINKNKILFEKGIPLYLYSAGAIGVFTVLFSNISFSALGASITIALSLLGQSIASIVIDHYGLLGMKVAKFEKKKLIGLLFISSGIVVMTIF